MIKGFSTRIASICIVLFLLASLIPLTESWGYNVLEAACSIGSIITTDGTNDPDIMLGCVLEDIMYGEADNDILQGRFDDDNLYGNSGDDNLEGGEGGDELYAGRGDDVIFAGFGDDF
jgi:Ca2+-binding RTX toxin-like protein